MDTSTELNIGAILLNDGASVVYSNFHILNLFLGFSCICILTLIGQKSNVNKITHSIETNEDGL